MAVNKQKNFKNQDYQEENLSVFEVTKLLLIFVNPKFGKDYYVQQFQEKAKEFYDIWKNDSKHAFQILKKITGYKLALNKKESKIANKVTVDGLIYDEDVSRQKILDTFEDSHKNKNNHQELTSTDFSEIIIQDNTAFSIINWLQKEKAISYDCCGVN